MIAELAPMSWLAPLLRSEQARVRRRVRGATAPGAAGRRSAFDLQNGPVFRALLVRLSERDHRLLVTMHHIVSDGWSLGVFIREMAALHESAGGDSRSPLPPLPAELPRLRASGSGGPFERAECPPGVSLAFWRDELAGLPPGIDLPVDRPRPPVPFRGATARPGVRGSTPRRPSRLRRARRGREGATLFQVLLAGFQTLLARWSPGRKTSPSAPRSPAGAASSWRG